MRNLVWSAGGFHILLSVPIATYTCASLLGYGGRAAGVRVGVGLAGTKVFAGLLSFLHTRTLFVCRGSYLALRKMSEINLGLKS